MNYRDLPEGQEKYNQKKKIYKNMPYQKPPTICPICKKGTGFKFIQDDKNERGFWSLFECLKCRVQFLVPFKSLDAEQYKEDIGYKNKLERLRRESAHLIIRERWGMNQFLKHLPHKNPKDKKLLDIACGSGEFLMAMKHLGYEVYGVDFNREAVNFIKNNLGIKNVYAEDIFSFLENKKEEYDIIISFEILEHLDRPKKFIELVYQALKPGGYFAISVPNRNRLWGKINPILECPDFPNTHVTKWDSESLKHFIYPLKTIRVKKPLPIVWFISRLRLAIESIFQGKPTEKVKSEIGPKKYKFIKSVVESILYLPALFLFHILKFEGESIYILAKKE